MRTVDMVKAELVKIRHTSYWYIHIFTPVVGAILFLFYFTIYKDIDVYQKLNLIFELTAMIFPLLIGVIVGLTIYQEEKAAYFQIILVVPNRWKAILAKLIVLYFSGVASLIALYALFFVGCIIEQINNIPLLLLLQTILGLAFCNLIIYAFHIFISLKFGFGISMLIGVFECLQCILYSNIELQKVWKYIPFAWSIYWIKDIFEGRLLENIMQWSVPVVFTIIILFAIMFWFSRWERRKRYD